jgi:membrane protease YdiL (CAAX protease family)
MMAVFFVPFGTKFAIWEKTYPIETRLYMDIASALTILTATWSMTRFIDHRPLKTIGLAFDHIFRDFLMGLAVGGAWLGASIVIVWAFGWATPLMPIGFSWTILAGASVAMLFNVFAQEMILCGFVFQTIRSRSNVVTAIIVSSVLFSILHVGAFKGEWLPAINVFVAGVLFCLAYVSTGNLWFPISIHFAWDVLIGPVLGLSESGIRNAGGNWKMVVINGPQLFIGGAFGLEGGFIVTLTAFITILLMVLYKRQKIKT